MLRVARENLDSLSVSNAELLVGDLAGLPLADNSVDAAFANMVLHHSVDSAAMLKEMARIVRPGGTIVITDEVENPYEWMREEHADVWLGFTPEQVEGYFSEAGLADYGYVSRYAVMHPLHDLGRGRRHQHLRRLGARSRQNNKVLQEDSCENLHYRQLMRMSASRMSASRQTPFRSYSHHAPVRR